MAYYYHRIIIRARIKCRTLSCYIANQIAGGLLLKMLKHFEDMLNIFEFFHVKEIDWCM